MYIYTCIYTDVYVIWDKQAAAARHAQDAAAGIYIYIYIHTYNIYIYTYTYIYTYI